MVQNNLSPAVHEQVFDNLLDVRLGADAVEDVDGPAQHGRVGLVLEGLKT